MTSKVSDWLVQHPSVAKAIYWQEPGRVGRGGGAWPGWPAARKAALEAEFQAYAAGAPTNLVDPPANLLQVADDDFAFTRIGGADAWALFLSHVACGLWCEIGRKVAWSILDYPPDALAVLFDSRQMFAWRDTPTANEPGYVGAESPGYEFDFTSSGLVVPAPPQRVLRFLRQIGVLPGLRLEPPAPAKLSPLVGPARRREAVIALVDWCRHLMHFEGEEGAQVMQAFWGYRGFSPVSRMLDGTICPAVDATTALHYTAGCSGTAGLLRSVLRVINIPVEIRRPTDHALPWFALEDFGLCHGDDPYCRRMRYLPTQVIENAPCQELIWSAPFAASELFIDAAQYDQWFAPTVPPDQRLANVDRIWLALDLEYLPYSVLTLYCDDLASGSATVAAYFSAHYALEDLKAARLWERLAAKLPTVGGCPVPPS